MAAVKISGLKWNYWCVYKHIKREKFTFIEKKVGILKKKKVKTRKKAEIF